MVSSAGQNTISRKGMANMAVPIPECDEQREIVRTLSALFNKEQQAKEAAETVLSQIDTMKKAILARAFRGELGTNDSAEESAVELIKSVL
jgi:type I restriction enzyme S subunit